MKARETSLRCPFTFPKCNLLLLPPSPKINLATTLSSPFNANAKAKATHPPTLHEFSWCATVFWVHHGSQAGSECEWEIRQVMVETLHCWAVIIYVRRKVIWLRHPFLGKNRKFGNYFNICSVVNYLFARKY